MATEEVNLKEYLFREVDLIQGIINRMTVNSFIVKGWAVTLVVGSFLLQGAFHSAAIAFVPLLAFWFLDAYFLWQERMYRKLYEWVIANRLKNKDYLLDMNAYRFRGKVQSRLRMMFSMTLLWFYGSIAILMIVY